MYANKYVTFDELLCAYDVSFLVIHLIKLKVVRKIIAPLKRLSLWQTTFPVLKRQQGRQSAWNNPFPTLYLHSNGLCPLNGSQAKIETF